MIFWERLSSNLKMIASDLTDILLNLSPPVEPLCCGGEKQKEASQKSFKSRVLFMSSQEPLFLHLNLVTSKTANHWKKRDFSCKSRHFIFFSANFRTLIVSLYCCVVCHVYVRSGSRQRYLSIWLTSTPQIIQLLSCCFIWRMFLQLLWKVTIVCTCEACNTFPTEIQTFVSRGYYVVWQRTTSAS